VGFSYRSQPLSRQVDLASLIRRVRDLSNQAKTDTESFVLGVMGIAGTVNLTKIKRFLDRRIPKTASPQWAAVVNCFDVPL
jgi:hypothetical protein